MHTVTSKVETVTVYRRGARVTRLAEIAQPPQGWPDQLRLDDLPLTMLDASLSARLEFPLGGGGLVARELRVELQSRTQAAPLATPDLRHEISMLQIQLERLESDIAKMQKLEPGSLVIRAAQPPQGFPLQARRAVVELRQKTLAAWLPRRNQLQQRLAELHRRHSQGGAQPRSAPLELSKSVVLNLRSKPDAQAPRLRLFLSYQVEGACWAPGYSLRFDRDYSLAELELRALVCQSSGEDWSQVQLAVSTAEPDSWTELPQLPSRRLGRHQSRSTPGWRPLPPNSEALLADYDGVALTPRALPRDNFGHPPLYLSDLQIVAAALMLLDPEVSSLFFRELGADHTHSLVQEIARMPQLEPGERQQVSRFVAGQGEDLQVLSRQQPEVLLQRMLHLLASQRPARQTRPQPRRQAELYCVKASSSCDIADLLCDRSGSSRVAPPPPDLTRLARNYCWELSSDQLAFDLLYLPGAEEKGRGRLQPQSPIEASLKRWNDPATAREARLALEEAQRDGLRALHQTPPTGHCLPAAVKSQDWLYQGESRLNIAGDCQYHSVPLLRRQLPAALHWLVVPKVTCDVFRQVELECPADLALPAGPADLFVGSDYLACVELEPVAAGESFLLDMGVETAVRVVRNAGFQEQAAGLMGGTLQLRHEIQIEAQNYLSRQVRLQIREPLPQVSEGSDCKVRLESQWQALPEKTGHFCWLSLAPGQKADCHFSYFIEMSNRLELVGGNRREK